MRTLRLLLAASLVPAAAEAQLAVRPGLYELTIEVVSSGGEMKEGMEAFLGATLEDGKILQCMTAEDLRGGLAQALARATAEDGMCRLSDVKTAGNRMTYVLTCEEDGVRMVMQNELTLTGTDAFTAVTTVTDAQGTATTMKLTAKRVGDCPPGPAPPLPDQGRPSC